MRVVTWNCCRGNASSKLARLAPLGPDLSVIQECGQLQGSAGSVLWFGDNQRQGVAVVSSSNYALQAAPQRQVPRYNVPIFVTGPHSFLLLAVWSQKESSYVEGMISAIHAYQDLIRAQPTIIIGDFNSNVLWDADHSTDRNHSALVRLCSSFGLISAYHHFYKVGQGSEPHATFYFQWKQARRYHIDYCFVPKRWARHVTSVVVGSYEDWVGASDHRPLIVDLALPVAQNGPRPAKSVEKMRSRAATSYE